MCTYSIHHLIHQMRMAHALHGDNLQKPMPCVTPSRSEAYVCTQYCGLDLYLMKRKQKLSYYVSSHALQYLTAHLLMLHELSSNILFLILHCVPFLERYLHAIDSMDFGIVPLNLFELISKETTFFQLDPSPSGTSPLNWLFCKWKVSSAFKAPSSEGIRPIRLLWSSSWAIKR